MSRYTVTTPIYYVSDKPHIGHAYTTIVADMLARLHRLKGEDVYFLTGTDEHGTKIAEAAAKAGTEPQKFTDRVAGQYINAWRNLNISYDDFIRTTDEKHEEGVRNIINELKEKDLIYEKEYEGLYCVGCEAFVSERDLDDKGLEPLHQKKPVVVKEKNWFFKLSKFLPQIHKAVTSGKLNVQPEERKNEVLGLLDQGLDDFSISRARERVKWGIPLPFDESQVVYVWVDALFNYITALGYGSSDTTKFNKYWPADTQLMAQDILKFHAVYWPALLMGLGIDLPKTLAVHGFFTINGQKLSKSLGNAIDPNDLVKKNGADAVRYLLVTPFPFGNSGDVAVKDFAERYRTDLSHNYGNLVTRTTNLVEKFCAGNTPAVSANKEITREIVQRYEKIEQAAEEGDALEEVNILRYSLNEISGLLNQEIDKAAPWAEKDKEKRDRVLQTMLEGVLHATNFAAPLMPGTASKVAEELGLTKLVFGKEASLSEDKKINKIPALFPPVA